MEGEKENMAMNQNGWGFGQNSNNYGFVNNIPVTNSMIPGRMINSIDDMKPQDVPMGGNPAVFLQNDAQCIYVKFWDKNCNIQTLRYVRDDSPIPQPEKPKDPIDIIMERLDKIDRRIDSITTQPVQNDYPRTSDAQVYYGTEPTKEV